MKDESTPTPTNPAHTIFVTEGIASQESVGRPVILEKYPHWQYYLAIERDLIETAYYVEPVHGELQNVFYRVRTHNIGRRVRN
jgi:hypothetical protein